MWCFFPLFLVGFFFFSACGCVVPVFSFGHYFGTVTQNFPGLLAISFTFHMGIYQLCL